MISFIPKRFTLTLVFLFFAIGLIASFIAIDRLIFADQVTKTALENGVGKTAEREKFFKNFLGESSSLLSGIADSHIFHTYLAGNNSDVKSLFLSVASTTTSIMQLRYIDKNGMERIRVDRRKQGDLPYIVEDGALQNKSDRYYFIQSQTKPPNRVWYTKIDLNEEHGRVEVPYSPTLRAILPLSSGGKFNGILIVNYFMAPFFEQFFNAPLYNMILSDGKGYPLVHYQKNKSWGAYTHPAFNLSGELSPRRYRAVFSHKTYKDDLLVSRKLNLGIDQDLYLILQLKDSYVEKELKNTMREYLFIAAIVALLSLIVSWLLSGIIRNLIESRGRLFNQLESNRQILQQTLDEQQALLEVKTTGFVHIKDRRFLWTNETFETILGYQRGELQGLPTRILYADEAEYVRYGNEAYYALATKGIYTSELHAKKKDGTPVILIASLTALKNGSNEAMGVAFDVTSQKMAEHSLQLALKRNSDLLDIINRYVSYTKIDGEGNIEEISTRFCTDLGCTKEKFVGRNISEIIAHPVQKQIFNHMCASVSRDQTQTFDVECKNANNTIHWYRVSISPDHTDSGDVSSCIAFYENIDKLVMFKNRSETDALTGLSNRLKIDETLLFEQSRTARSHKPFSVILVDIDHFKEVNDTYGHHIGDLILQEFSRTLKSNIRSIDTIGRWGGEEFLILCPFTDKNGAYTLAETLLNAINKTDFSIVGKQTASFGVSEYQEGEHLDDLFKRVDKALYSAKKSGRNRVEAF